MSLQIEGLCWGHSQPGGSWRQLFKDFKLECPSAQFLVLIGSNGSGKSTLLNLIAGSLKLQAGSLRLKKQTLATLEGLPQSPLDWSGNAKPPRWHRARAHDC